MMKTDQLYVITGCSGGGKSTLLDVLERRGHRVMPEPGRIIVREELAGDGSALPWVDMEKFAIRAIAMGKQFHAEALKGEGPVFFDRSVLDAVAALERLGLSTGEKANNLLQRLRYAPVAFIAPPWPELFETDGERQLGLDQALEEYAHLCRFYPASGYDLVELPKASVAERANFIEAKARSLA